jgi:hypothetical protein
MIFASIGIIGFWGILLCQARLRPRVCHGGQGTGDQRRVLYEPCERARPEPQRREDLRCP